MTNTFGTATKPSRIWVVRQAGRLLEVVDRRTSSRWPRRAARRAFPDHWSSWLGYIALFSFMVIILSGVFLTLWFQPSMTPVVYDGGYAPLTGVQMSEAYASTLGISFEVRGGLLMRQVHYWATHVLIASMAVHLLHVFFTGGFRGPRKSNWLVGLGLLVLGIVGGYTGHALPDDLLSGTGLRVIEGGVLAIPIVGTHLSSLIFGGEYPGEDIVARLHAIHVFVLPTLIVALLVAHLVLARRQRNAAQSGAGTRTGVGTSYRVHTARASGLSLIVVGVIVLMAATLQINPVWLRGPYDPSQVSAGSQPDWYIAFLDGGLRLMPPWQIDVFGHELTLSVLVPAIVLPGIILMALAIYPWIEEKIIGTDGDLYTPERPRSMPVRTALGAAFIAFYLALWIAAGNDVLATVAPVPVNWTTGSLRFGVVLLPVLAYVVTKRICLGLQRRDHEAALNGLETGITVAGPDGGFSQMHRPLSPRDARTLASRYRKRPFEPGPEYDENGIPAPRRRWSKLRARLSRAYVGEQTGSDCQENYQ